LNKKVLAIAIAGIMILGLFTALTPAVQAQVPTACPNAATPAANYGSPFCVYLHPGAVDAYKSGWSHTLDTLNGTQAAPGHPGQPDTNPQTRQVFDNYLDYSILASSSDSIGDLQFDFTIPAAMTLAPTHNGTEIRAIEIWVPPEFEWLAPTREEAIWTDITNDYQYIYTSRRSEYDSFGPNWIRVRIGADQWFGATANITAGTYHVRLFDLKAPSVAGLYHFKIRYWTMNAAHTAQMPVALPYGDYPIIVVKNELNPAWIETTVRTHAFPAVPYVSGSVLAEGTTPEGRAVSSIGYWSAANFIGNSVVAGEMGAMYRLYLFGVAEGTYTLKAEASGFNPTVTDRFPVYAGQSYHRFIVIFDSPEVHVTIWSKHGTGAIPWHNLWNMPFGTNNPAAAPADGGPHRDMLVNLYDADGVLIGWWASDAIGVKDIPFSNTLAGLHDDGDCIPTQTQWNGWLVDNEDTWHNARFYPSTIWDGHVPAPHPDYIAGMPNGQYTVEAYVTGYIMEEADAYQRTFSLVGSNYNLQFDLRRTNWIEVSMHVPANVVLSGTTSVTLTAEDAAGNERAAIAFYATPAMITGTTPWVLDGWDVTAGAYHGGLVIEGFSNVFPNTEALGAARDINKKDYGLNPTAATHSMGQVSLAGNPYSIKLFMADMGLPWARVNGTGWYNIVGDQVTTVALCNSAAPLSFKIVNAWLWISLRSVDFEVPAHSRPWTFPGSEIWVNFVNEAGENTDILDPTLYGLIQDAGLWNWTAGAPWNYIGWHIPGTEGVWGAGHNSAGTHVGWGVSPFDMDNVNPAGMHEHVGVYYYGSDYAASSTLAWGAGNHWQYGWVTLDYLLAGLYRSTRLPAGMYNYEAYTHGYVQRRSFPVQVPFAGGADIEADLIQGGQIRVTMDFKHEAVATPFNGWVRVEVFDSAGALRGASIYGQADPNHFTTIGTPGVAGGYLNYTAFSNHLWNDTGPAQAADFGWANATLPHLENFLFPSSEGFGHNNGQRAYTSHMFYNSTWNATWTAPPAGWMYPARNIPLNTWTARGSAHGAAEGIEEGWPWMDPSFANRLNMTAGEIQSFDVYGFYWYHGDAARTWAGGWPTVNGWNTAGFPNWWVGDNWDYGLKGTVDIPGWEGSGGGLYSVKVWAFDGLGPDGVYGPVGGVQDDWRMYSMGWPLENIDVPWGGSVELFIHMNNMASLRGTIRWFDMFGNLRPLPWAQISATNPDTVAYSSGNGGLGSTASDPSGAFIMWLPAGSHDVSVSTSEAPQVWAPGGNDAYTIVVSDGWVSNNDSQLSSSGTPVPELPAFVVPLSLFAALAASAWLLRKSNYNIPVLMK